MRRLDKKKIIENLKVVFKEAIGVPPDFDMRQPGIIFPSENIAILDKSLDKFNAAVNAIFEDEYLSERLSKHFAWKALRNFIQSNWEEYKAGTLDFQKALDDKITELQKSIEKYTVIIPIGGIKFERSRVLKIGSTLIRPYRRSDLALRRIRKNTQFGSYLDSLEGQVVGFVEVEGELNKARENALNEISKVLNVLRFYVPLFHSKSNQVQIRIMTEIMIGAKYGTFIDSPKKRILYSGESPAGILAFKINNQNLKKMRKYFFNDINNLLNKNVKKLSKYEKEILLGIKWYGTAVDMTDPVLKFLNYAIVLEILISKQEKDSDRTITDKLAEGIAFILSNKFSQRSQIKKRVKNLYRIRSAIVHRGKDFVEDKYIDQIEWLGFVLILELTKKKDKFNSKNDLLKWFEEKRLG